MKTNNSIEEILNIEKKRFGIKSKLLKLLVLGTISSTIAVAEPFKSSDFNTKSYLESGKLCLDSISYDGTKPNKYDFGAIIINYDCNGNITSSTYSNFKVPNSRFNQLKEKSSIYYDKLREDLESSLKSKLFLTMLLKKNQ